MFNISSHRLISFAVLCGSLLSGGVVFAQGEEALIRKNLKERMPHIQPIDEIRERGVPAEGVLLRRIERFLIEVEGDVSAGPARARSWHTG